MFLNYLVYPYFMGYFRSAAFTFGGRIFDAFRYNCFYYVLYAIGAVIAMIVYFAFQSVQDAVEKQGFIGVALGMSIAFGFMVLTVFVGYGLIGIPQYLWRRSSF